MSCRAYLDPSHRDYISTLPAVGNIPPGMLAATDPQTPRAFAIRCGGRGVRTLHNYFFMKSDHYRAEGEALSSLITSGGMAA